MGDINKQSSFMSAESAQSADFGDRSAENISSATSVVNIAGSGIDDRDVDDIPTRISKIFSRPSYPGFADIVEMEAVQRLSKSHVDPTHVIELVKSRDLTKFHEAKKMVEEEQPTSGKSEFAHLPLEDIMNKFGLEDTVQGLSDAQILFNREMYGDNVLDLGKKDPIWKIFLSQFKSYVIVLLFVAAVASMALKNYIEGGFIIFIVTVNSIMATYMERSAANVLEKLARLSSPVARVIRNNTEVEIASKEIVPGDILVLKTGDTVVADIRLFEVMEMRINESLLTGESVDIKKTTVSEDMDSPFSTNLCFASTSVVSGFGKGIVINTGMNTQVGKIAKQLKKASETSKITPLQRGLNRLGGTIGIISTLVLVTIVIVAILTKFDDPTRPNTNRTLSIVLLAVGFAASSIPEGLPMVVTISLSLGAKDMAKENANVLKLPAVETLGCCSIICSDKTGTLTEGKMVTTDVVLFYSSSGSKSNTAAQTSGSKLTHTNLKLYPTYGFNPRGGVFYADQMTDEFAERIIRMYKKKDFDFFQFKDNLVAELPATEAAAKAGPRNKQFESAFVKVNLLTCYLNSYNTKLVFEEETNRWTCVGNMTESPLVVAATKCGLAPDVFEDYPRVDRLEVPFNSKRKMCLTVHKLKNPNFYDTLSLQRGSEIYTHVALVKGAPDVLRKYCRYLVAAGPSGGQMSVNYNQTLGNSTETRARPNSANNYADSNLIMKMNNNLSKNSLRVIMIGIVPLTDKEVEHLSKFEDSDQRQHFILTGMVPHMIMASDASDSQLRQSQGSSWGRTSAEIMLDSKSMVSRQAEPKLVHRDSLDKQDEVSGRVVLLGITGSFDPPRPGVRDAIETCKSAGVRVIMITGDQKTTAVAIGKQIGLDEMRLPNFAEASEDKDKSDQPNNDQPAQLSAQSSQLTDEIGLECSHLHINNNPNMDYLPDEEIDLITSKYNVFCRAQPDDKVAIVNSLKRKGEITAMTGDGVNDAAALKTADIGISMGINGTDVAKGASELVLLDDNFCTIVKAVTAGRTIYSNIQKFVSFLLGTNIGEILYLTTSIIIRTLPPVEALQILFLNFLTDGCPAVALSREPADEDAMKRPPRKPNTPIMTKEWWLLGNLPHTIFEAMAVIASILIGLYLCTGVLTLNDIHGQCKYIHLKDASGSSHEMVYFCESFEYRFTTKYRGWVTNITYYDPYDQNMKTFLGAAKGKKKFLKTSDPDLHPKLKEKFAEMSVLTLFRLDQEMCKWVELDKNGWVRSTDAQIVGSKIYGAGRTGFREIVARKASQARTISFITAVWSEMLRAYTVRSWDYFYKVFNRNPWMHVACSVSATVTFALTIIPGLSNVLHVVSLTYWQYILAIAFALATLVLDECISKVLYHRIHKRKALK